MESMLSCIDKGNYQAFAVGEFVGVILLFLWLLYLGRS
jgi:hypothetical protein